MDPKYELNAKILWFCTQISKLLGKYEGFLSPVPQPKLRKKNRIKTIQATSAIEGNTLSIEQVTAILDHKRVIGSAKEILEIENANKAYEIAHHLNPYSISSILKAHKTLMKGLVSDAGSFRAKNVGVFQGSQVKHIAPPPKRVPDLIRGLFQYLKNEKDLSLLLQSAIVHYEIEFIHPFSDGNGRIGRLWQHLILLKYHSLFKYIPFESIIHKKQKKYYQVLEKADHYGNCTIFIEFSLDIILEGLQETLKEVKPTKLSTGDRLTKAKGHFGSNFFSRKDYLIFFKTLSTATASRDLQYGVKNKVLKKIGDKALAQYQFHS